MTGGCGRVVASRARIHSAPRGADIISGQPQLPKGHTAILSPAFKYVPAASTDLARTFARIRGERLTQPGTGASVPARKPEGAG